MKTIRNLATIMLPTVLIAFCALLNKNSPTSTPVLATATPSITWTITPQWFYSVPSTPILLLPISTPLGISAANDWWTKFENNQTTDGNLVLFVREMKPECHEAASQEAYYPVEFALVNNSQSDLIIPARFAITRSSEIISDINPGYFSEGGSRLNIRVAGTWIDDAPGESIHSLKTVSSKGSFVTILEIPYPYLPPDNYIVKFAFQSLDKSASGSDNLWTGLINSNPIKICFK